MSKYDEAIKYFEDAIQESDEIIADCSPKLQAELASQREHFIVALSALRKMCSRPLRDGERFGSKM